jgi:glycosyltransferase involved in cell wall biosynthesis
MLREAVGSVLGQTWGPIEIIIVNDGSTDDTLQVAHALRAEHPSVIRVLDQSNTGPGAARQAGVDSSQGEFVQFLDSDDRLLPEKFTLQVAALRADSEASICYGKTYTTERGVVSPVPAQRSAERHRTLFPALLAGRLWETSTPLYRRNALDRIGRWSDKRQMEDWEFDAKAGAAGMKLHFCDAYVSEYRIHGEHRLAHAWMDSSQAMRDRLAVYLQIFDCAKQAQVPHHCEEMQRYGRTLFWAARMAGSAGYGLEAEDLIRNAAQIARGHPKRAAQVWLYRRFAAMMGWRFAGFVSTLPKARAFSLPMEKAFNLSALSGKSRKQGSDAN